MRKTLLLAAAAMLYSLGVFAQSAFETTGTIRKTVQPAFKIELNYAPDIVEAALKKNFRDIIDQRGDENKNVRTYKGALLTQISPEKMDYYTTVEQKSKKEKNTSVVYLWVSSGYDNFVSGQNNPTVASNALQFLNNFMGTAADYKQGLDIKAQEEAVARAGKRVNGVNSDIADYEKRIREYQQKLEQARKDLTERQAELDQQKQKLEQMKAGQKL